MPLVDWEMWCTGLLPAASVATAPTTEGRRQALSQVLVQVILSHPHDNPLASAFY